MKDFIYLLKEINDLAPKSKIVLFLLAIIVLCLMGIVVKALTLPVIVISFATSYLYDTFKTAKQECSEIIKKRKEKEQKLKENSSK